MRFEVKEIEHSKNDFIYISFGTNNNNPLEIEKDLKEIMQFLKDKWIEKKTNYSFKEWLNTKLCNNKQKSNYIKEADICFDYK